ncbi:hypothetical protein [Nostoc sp. TCL26-01]|uniref:hypothetical protein n=1 Tax=Nostoc sp. TCL26-01 TaxID=2576904 RepID=UPI0015BDF33F|nr:hypothetical protein [Nostoc sp. TCL26-01]QLE56710.1 hypothetical protein FD725_15075 [Nostoc sp. TCL26-01]
MQYIFELAPTASGLRFDQFREKFGFGFIQFLADFHQFITVGSEKWVTLGVEVEESQQQLMG